MIKIRSLYCLLALSVLAACTTAPTPQYIGIPPMEGQPSATITLTPLAASTPILRATLTLAPTATAVPRLTVLPTPTPIYPYRFPVQPARIARYKPGGHPYPATDIFAPAGQKFVAVTDGVVKYVSLEDKWDPAVDAPETRGGLSVGILGVDGFLYYGSHLESIENGIAVGIPVKAGQVLGYVGNTGNARDKDPHLHFGISAGNAPLTWDSRRGEIDPIPCLDMWLQGFPCTPQP